MATSPRKQRSRLDVLARVRGRRAVGSARRATPSTRRPCGGVARDDPRRRRPPRQLSERHGRAAGLEHASSSARGSPPGRPWCAPRDRRRRRVDGRHELERRVEVEHPPSGRAHGRRGSRRRPARPRRASSATSVASPLASVGSSGSTSALLHAATARPAPRARAGRALAIAGDAVVPVEVDGAGRGPDARDPHAVLGEGAGLVGADHRRRARASRPRSSRLTRAPRRASTRTPTASASVIVGSSPSGTLATRRPTANTAASGNDSPAASVPSGRNAIPTATATAAMSHATRRTSPLEWALVDADPLGERGDAAELGVHPGGEHDGLGLAAGADRAAEHEIAGLEVRRRRGVVELGRTEHRQRLAGQRGDVELDGAVEQTGIGGDAVALGDEQARRRARACAASTWSAVPVAPHGRLGRAGIP